MLSTFVTLFLLFGDGTKVLARPSPLPSAKYAGDSPPYPIPADRRDEILRRQGELPFSASSSGTGTGGTGVSTASSTSTLTPSSTGTSTIIVSGTSTVSSGSSTGISPPASTDTPTSVQTPLSSTGTPTASTDTLSSTASSGTSSASGLTWTGPGGTGTGNPPPSSTGTPADTPLSSTGTPLSTGTPSTTGTPSATSTPTGTLVSSTGTPTGTGTASTGTPSATGGATSAPSTTATPPISTTSSWDPFLVLTTSTTPWPSLSTDVQTNSDWKTNFWLSTTGTDGQPTEVPVVHCGCICRGTCDQDNDDDSKFVWVIFWNVPKLPNVQFSLPKLPDFHFPSCINILGIKLGDCPPTSDNGDHGHSDPDDPKNKNQPPEDDGNDPTGPTQTTGPQSTPQSTPASTPSTASTSSCTGSVVTDWVTKTICPTSGASAQQCTTTSSSSLRTGCSITGVNTATASAGSSCPRLTYIDEGAGVGYSDPGFSYGTYSPPTITGTPSGTVSGATTTPAATGSVPSTNVVTPTTLSTITVPSSTDTPPSSTGTPNPSTPSSVATPKSSTVVTPSPPPSSTPTPPAPSSTAAALPPKPSQGKTCAGTNNKVWMDRDGMASAIDKFCSDAGAQGVHDKDSGSIRREYNQNTPDHIIVSMDWPQEIDFKANTDDCHKVMYDIMDGCDGNDPTNPMDWKHGGVTVVDWTKYNVIVATGDKYKAGVCSLHVHEIEKWSGVDGPGTERTWWFYVQLSLKDADGTVVGGTGNDHVEAGDKSPATVKGYWADMVVTPEAHGDYIQFTVGSSSWKSSDKHETDTNKNVVPGCNVGGFDSDYSPAGRDMDCWINC